MVFRASLIARVAALVGAVAALAVCVYALGSAFDRWGARLCVVECSANDTAWFPLIVGVVMGVGAVLLAIAGWQLSTHRSSLSRHGVSSSRGGGVDDFLEWSEIERFELVGRPGHPAQVHAVADDGTTMRLRGLVVRDGDGRDPSPARFRDLVAAHAPAPIPVERRP